VSQQIRDARSWEGRKQFGGKVFPESLSCAKAATRRARVSGQSVIGILDAAIPSAGGAAMDPGRESDEGNSALVEPTGVSPIGKHHISGPTAMTALRPSHPSAPRLECCIVRSGVNANPEKILGGSTCF
jgi:hypothetical protein